MHFFLNDRTDAEDSWYLVPRVGHALRAVPAPRGGAGPAVGVNINISILTYYHYTFYRKGCIRKVRISVQWLCCSSIINFTLLLNQVESGACIVDDTFRLVILLFLSSFSPNSVHGLLRTKKND